VNTVPVLGLHMIVRDEEDSIVACLDSVLPHVDRAYILDTGSTDATRELVADALVRHGHHPDRSTGEAEWPAGRFGEARSIALARLYEQHPDVTHVCWVDADDLVHGAEHLRSWCQRIMGQTAPDGTRTGAGVMHYAYAHDQHGNLACTHYRERIVVREALHRWVGEVHEVLQLHPGWSMSQIPVPPDASLARVPTVSWPVAPDGVEIIHVRPYGKVATTRGRNMAILEEQRAANPNDPRTLFYLGQEYAIHAAMARDEGDEGTWREYLGRAVEVLHEYDAIAVWDEERYQAAHRRADFLRDLGDHEAAAAADMHATTVLPSWPDAWHGLAESHLHLGRPELARVYSDAGFARPYPVTMMIVNPTDYTLTAWEVRSRIEAAAGQTVAARDALARAFEYGPTDQVIARRLQVLDEQVNRAKTKEAFLLVDEVLARHDENLKAAALLTDCVPYFLEWDPEVAARRNRRRHGVRHVTEGDRYAEFYEEANPHIPITRATGIDDPWQAITRLCEGDPEAGVPGLPRAQFLLAGLREQAGCDDLSSLTVLDVGCNDGWLGLWLVKAHGLGQYVGFDLNAESLAGGMAMREELGLSPDAVRFVHGPARWDPFEWGGWPSAVVSFEVIEHVPDAGDWLDYLADLGGGQATVYVSTPNGAFERGNVAEWDSPAARGHVRAMQAGDLASLALDRGELVAVGETRDGLVVTSFTPRDRDQRIDLYLGPAGGTWSPLDALDSYLGGSETMAVRLATQLATQGHRVRVWCGVPHRMAVHQVEYLPWWAFDPTVPVDVLIGSRCPGLIAQHPNAGHRVLWLHDAEYPDLDAHDTAWDQVWCVSQWQLRHLHLSAHPGARVLPNGIPLDRWGEPRLFADREPWVVYSSSPDRGLLNLIRIWPRILAVAPAAQLHVAYGFNQTWRGMEAAHPELARVRAEVEDAMSMPGFVWHGQMGQLALAELQGRARVWAYPTDFPEVSCITAMEAQAAGLAIVTTRTAALVETVGDAGVLLDGPAAEWGEPEDTMFAHQVATLLTSAGSWRVESERARAGAPRWSVEEVGRIAAEHLAAGVPA